MSYPHKRCLLLSLLVRRSLGLPSKHFPLCAHRVSPPRTLKPF